MDRRKFGKTAASGFTEMIALTDPMPDGNDPSLGPAVTRALPEDPNLPWTPAIKTGRR
jgi:hypothetical protein